MFLVFFSLQIMLTCIKLFSLLKMEGEKEKQWEQQEEKESNEAEDDTRSDDETCNEVEDGNSERAVMVWQEGHEKDELGNPIMHWEALSLCIAELEKQEEEKKAKVRASFLTTGFYRWFFSPSDQ